jgi:hypothetical protein
VPTNVPLEATGAVASAATDETTEEAALDSVSSTGLVVCDDPAVPAPPVELSVDVAPNAVNSPSPVLDGASAPAPPVELAVDVAPNAENTFSSALCDGTSVPAPPVELRVDAAPDTDSSVAPVGCDWAPLPAPPFELKAEAAPDAATTAVPATVVAFASTALNTADSVEEGRMIPNPPVELNVEVWLEIVKAPEPCAETAVADAPGLSKPDPATALVNVVAKELV